MNEKESRERSGQKIEERFEFREIRPEEAGEAAQIEKACFPPNEACTEVMMRERAAKAPEVFLVAVDRKSGKMAGFLNGLATDEVHLRDEFFQNADLHAPEGRTLCFWGCVCCRNTADSIWRRRSFLCMGNGNGRAAEKN